MIPKTLHFVWVGDADRLPREDIDTWVRLNPTYDVRIWTDSDLNTERWALQRHIDDMYPIELCGVADMMRYEIVFLHGGIALDADSRCVRPLDDHLLEPREFFCYENERKRPGLIATAVMAGEAQSPFYAELINRLYRKPTVVDQRAWKSTGPTHVTETYLDSGIDITVYPSHYFIPNHYTGQRYSGGGAVYAEQVWGSTV